METPGSFKGMYRVIGLYGGYFGIMEKRTETLGPQSNEDA